MAAESSSVRRSTRASQQPLSLAEEQAADVLSAMEQRDIAAALRLSLHDSWDSDEERSGAESDDDADAAMEEEEEKQAAAPAEEEAEWTSKLQAIEIPPPRIRHLRQHPPPADATPLQLLQLFLPPSLMEEFAHHTNAAAPPFCRDLPDKHEFALLSPVLLELLRRSFRGSIRRGSVSD